MTTQIILGKIAIDVLRKDRHCMKKIKKKKADKSRNAPNAFNPSALTWTDNDGVHLLV